MHDLRQGVLIDADAGQQFERNEPMPSRFVLGGAKSLCLFTLLRSETYFNADKKLVTTGWAELVCSVPADGEGWTWQATDPGTRRHLDGEGGANQPTVSPTLPAHRARAQSPRRH